MKVCGGVTAYILTIPSSLPVPVAVRSKAWICGRSPAETVGSNSAEGMDVCLVCVLCIVR